MTTTFVTANQAAHLQAALALTGSEGFMEDARAVAAYKPGKEGRDNELAVIAVFECFRAGRAELHLGMAGGRPITAEIIQAMMMIAFGPKFFNLNRILARVPAENVVAITTLLRLKFQIEYRDRASVTGGRDAIVLSLDRDAILRATAEPHTEQTPAEGE